jgi:ubiquinone biosynthesis protein UbiJ
VLGPIAGQQVADMGRRLLALPEHAARRFGDSLGRYVAEETRLAVDTAEARAFAAEVSALDARVDALAARIEALAGADKS